MAIWWIFLVTISLFNICQWFRTYSRKFSKVPLSFSFRNNSQSIIWFSALYVFGCACRSVLLRADVQRICLFDTWFSSVLVGRTVATVAEVAFIIQWFIVLRFLSEVSDSKTIKRISGLIIPLILMSETFS